MNILTLDQVGLKETHPAESNVIEGYLKGISLDDLALTYGMSQSIVVSILKQYHKLLYEHIKTIPGVVKGNKLVKLAKLAENLESIIDSHVEKKDRLRYCSNIAKVSKEYRQTLDSIDDISGYEAGSKPNRYMHPEEIKDKVEQLNRVAKYFDNGN